MLRFEKEEEESILPMLCEVGTGCHLNWQWMWQDVATIVESSSKQSAVELSWLRVSWLKVEELMVTPFVKPIGVAL